MTDRQPGEGRYAQVEREQRWLLREVPVEATRTTSIVDRYVIGTRLRLRRAENSDGVVFKFAQKVRVNPADPEVVKLTNMYLSADEYAVLSGLPAVELRKSRWRVASGDNMLTVDELHDRLDGIVLAEIELAPNEMFVTTPPFAIKDITNDNRFSGGGLAFATDEQIEALMVEVGRESSS
jgi:CYTH domain-containing protein